MPKSKKIPKLNEVIEAAEDFTSRDLASNDALRFVVRAFNNNESEHVSISGAIFPEDSPNKFILTGNPTNIEKARVALGQRFSDEITRLNRISKNPEYREDILKSSLQDWVKARGGSYIDDILLKQYTDHVTPETKDAMIADFKVRANTRTHSTDPVKNKQIIASKERSFTSSLDNFYQQYNSGHLTSLKEKLIKWQKALATPGCLNEYARVSMASLDQSSCTKLTSMSGDHLAEAIIAKSAPRLHGETGIDSSEYQLLATTNQIALPGGTPIFNGSGIVPQPFTLNTFFYPDFKKIFYHANQRPDLTKQKAIDNFKSKANHKITTDISNQFRLAFHALNEEALSTGKPALFLVPAPGAFVRGLPKKVKRFIGEKIIERLRVVKSAYPDIEVRFMGSDKKIIATDGGTPFGWGDFEKEIKALTGQKVFKDAVVGKETLSLSSQLTDAGYVLHVPAMADPVNPMGNGASGPRANSAADEYYARVTAGMDAIAVNPYQNPLFAARLGLTPKLLDKAVEARDLEASLAKSRTRVAPPQRVAVSSGGAAAQADSQRSVLPPRATGGGKASAQRVIGGALTAEQIASNIIREHNAWLKVHGRDLFHPPSGLYDFSSILSHGSDGGHDWWAYPSYSRTHPELSANVEGVCDILKKDAEYMQEYIHRLDIYTEVASNKTVAIDKAKIVRMAKVLESMTKFGLDYIASQENGPAIIDRADSLRTQYQARIKNGTTHAMFESFVVAPLSRAPKKHVNFAPDTKQGVETAFSFERPDQKFGPEMAAGTSHYSPSARPELPSGHQSYSVGRPGTGLSSQSHPPRAMQQAGAREAASARLELPSGHQSYAVGRPGTGFSAQGHAPRTMPAGMYSAPVPMTDDSRKKILQTVKLSPHFELGAKLREEYGNLFIGDKKIHRIVMPEGLTITQEKLKPELIKVALGEPTVKIQFEDGAILALEDQIAVNTDGGLKALTSSPEALKILRSEISSIKGASVWLDQLEQKIQPGSELQKPSGTPFGATSSHNR